jgi:hypothetical protein
MPIFAPVTKNYTNFNPQFCFQLFLFAWNRSYFASFRFILLLVFRLYLEANLINKFSLQLTSKLFTSSCSTRSKTLAEMYAPFSEGKYFSSWKYRTSEAIEMVPIYFLTSVHYCFSLLFRFYSICFGSFSLAFLHCLAFLFFSLFFFSFLRSAISL